MNKVVTVDRYNHIDNAEKGVVVGHDMTVGGEILYKIKLNTLQISTTGKCIIESKHYEPLHEKERSAKRYTREERVSRWVAWITSK
ncbi:MAG TPA: hypothetical protein VNX68_09530 [Nitrosopumilaceae archaeon]|nr:hypothetical protein [Nitrosopumilaceae archaeon]